MALFLTENALMSAEASEATWASASANAEVPFWRGAIIFRGVAPIFQEYYSFRRTCHRHYSNQP